MCVGQVMILTGLLTLIENLLEFLRRVLIEKSPYAKGLVRPSGSLASFSPFIDQYGRLKKTSLDCNDRNPIVIPKNRKLNELRSLLSLKDSIDSQALCRVPQPPTFLKFVKCKHGNFGASI